MGLNPLSRKSDLVIRKLAGETLVYDLENDKVYCLNDTSSLIWKLCNGNRTVENICRIMSARLGKPVDDDVVKIALDQFAKNDLLDNSENWYEYFPGITRRKAIRKATLSLVALPIISTLTAPTSVSAQSGGLPLFSPCSTGVPGVCASGLNCTPDSIGVSGSGGPHCCLPGTLGGLPPIGQCVADPTICTQSSGRFCCNRMAGSMMDPSCPAPFPIRCTCAP